MKVYNKIVIDLKTSTIIESESFDYQGPLALAGGGGSAPEARQPIAGIVVRRLARGRDMDSPFGDRLESVGQIGTNDPYRNAAVERMTNSINAQYGARGLANSGIAMQGLTDAITNFDLGREEQKTDQAIKILSTASGGPTTLPGSQGSGFLGLK